MTAIRIIDDHLELASIGTKSHVQIDAHIAAAGDYVKRDGSLALTSDWDIGDTRKILADEIRARDAAGLKLYDDGGNGIFVEDGGNVGIGTDAPLHTLHVVNDSSGQTAYFRKNSGATNFTDVYSTLYLANENPTNNNWARFNFGNGQDQAAAAIGVQITNHTNRYGEMVFWTRGSGGFGERIRITNTGNIGIGTTTPSAKLDVNSDIFRLRTAKTPATAGSAGNQGDICWDTNYIYVCTATNTWERAAIAAW